MISNRLGILPGSLAATLFPAFSTSAGRGDGEWIRSALLRSLKYLLLTVGPAALVLIFFARPLLTLWLGAKFADEGALVLQILAVGVLTNSLAYVPYSFCEGWAARPDGQVPPPGSPAPRCPRLVPGHPVRSPRRGAGLDLACQSRFPSPHRCGLLDHAHLARLLAGRDLLRSVATLTGLAAGL